MADISQKELREEITAILKDADLHTTSAKKVRQQIEKKLDIDLSDRKKEVDDLVMECLQEKQDENKEEDEEEDEEEEEEEEEESEEEKKPKKRAAPKKQPAKRKKGSDSESEDEDEASDDDYSPKKKASPKKGAKGAAAKKTKGSDDSDDDWKQPKKKAAAKKAAGGGAKKGGGGGFTKVYNLSPELAAVVGSDTMARPEVVKKVWAIIKERNLYDPKNKQFAICDDQMMKVFKVKRFRTFGMMKYLKEHFLD